MHNLFSPNRKKKLKELVNMAKKLLKTISYRLEFIHITKSMASTLSNLVNNLAERIYKIKCKYEHNDKKI